MSYGVKYPLTSELAECPKCGQSGNGFTYSVWTHVDYGGFWGEEDHYVADEMAQIIDARMPKTVECGDCGGRIKVGDFR